MAAEEDTDTLKLYWDHFFKAETGTYEKSTWLDLFLAEFLIRLNEGASPKELIKFCPVSGVVTLVGCELLCGIHRVTSSITAHCAPPLPPFDATPTQQDPINPDEVKIQPTSLFTRTNAQSSQEILRKYLLGGVAWRCLVLLRGLGVEGLSCCRQLSSVLIWLFGELSEARGEGGEGGQGGSESAGRTVRAPPPCTTPIHQLFSHKIWSKQKPSGIQSGKVNSGTSSERGSTTARSRHTSFIKFESSDSKVKRKLIKDPDQSSESADSNDDLQILNRSLAIKVCSPVDDFEYFNSPMRSSNEYPNDSYYSDPYYTPRKIKPKADDYMNDKHREIINSEITTFEFTLIITDLLQELCKAESSLSGSEGSQISVQCINFSLRNLCSVQFSSTAVHNNQDISRIKVALTELLIVSLDKVLIHSDLCAKLINNGILPMLLRLLEDIISKCNKNRAKEIEKTESENLLKFVFGIAYSITAFFHCLLMQCRSVDKLREFTDQFKLYSECLKGGLLRECIELMIRIPVADVEESIILIKKLIESIGKLISGMKRVRSEVIHSAACPRSRHKGCRQRVAAGMHHHHDILGEASSGLPMASACCVSVLYETLTSLLIDEEVSAQNVLRNKILRVMLNCGVCCCFSPGIVMESIVRLMLTQNSVATLCLQVLEHTVYGDLGASILIPKITDQLPCSICEPDDRRDFIRNYCPLNISPIERKSMWSFLIHYNSLLQLDNHSNVLHATVSHLLRVTPKCRMEMKYELLFSVIYPTFIVAKHRYIIRLEESAYFITVSCLNIFASLLNTVSFAEQFIQKGGLSYVLELVSLSEFSNQCCAILEVAIIVEIFKLMKENSEMTYHREISTLPSVQMLFKSLSDVTELFYRIFKKKIPADKFSELCDVSKEVATLHLSKEEVQRSSSMAKLNNYSEEKCVETEEQETESLKRVCTLWRTCGRVCLFSPAFRAALRRRAVLLHSYCLLRALLHRLADAHSPPPHAHAALLIKILEALLTVHFSLSDVTGGMSKEAACAALRGALAACARGPHVRALCEALVRVATAQPSRNHVMPPRTLAKVPALACPAGGGASSCSSSEESAAAPYASEHSDPTAVRPDEGYEADVEVGKLELHQTYKARKMSTSMSTVTSDSGVQSCAAGVSARAEEAEGGGGQCGEYDARAALAHPELCVIVVDILTHLIDKLLQWQCSGESAASIERVGAQLARACRARLAAGPPAPPAPPLLQRLLAPAREHLLAHHHPSLHELQRSVVELISALAWQSVSGAEAAALLRLVLAPRPPLALLLPALRRLLRRAPRHTPDCILTFPVDTHNNEGLQEMIEEMNHLGLNNSTQNNYNDESDKLFQESHLKVGAVRCRAVSAGWCAWAAGFALTAWLHAPPAHDDTTEANDDDSSDNESTKKSAPREARGRHAELAHVVSIGHDSLMFEMWLQTNTGVLTYRLSRPEWSGGRVMGEARVCSGMAPRHWNHVAINVGERVHKRHMFIEVTTFVNGYQCESVALPLQGILVRKVIPTNVLVGHACRGGGGGGGGVGVYHLSRVCVYRAPLLTRYTALHLAAHGPDHSCQIKCDAPNYPLVLTSNILDSNIDWDQVYDISTATLRELHDNVVLTFSASAPYIINLYHQTVALPTVFGARVAGVAGVASAGAGGAGGGAGASIPETLAARWAGAALRSQHRGMAPAIYTLGGPDVLLYLYARVVELDGTAAEQAMALSILLRACRVDNRLYAMFYSGDSLEMLLTVFASPKCHVDHHLLTTVVRAACAGRVVRAGGGGAVLSARTGAVLLQPALFVLLLSAWRQLDNTQVTWEVEVGGGGSAAAQRGSALALWLACARALLRDEHPRREFNHYQMNRVGLLHHLLLACKERFLNSDCGPLDPTASNNLVEVVRGLIGTPPVLQRVALLCDFLLLMHQASDTFVTHSRANFYFLLTSETQEMSEFNSDVKRRASRRAKRRAESSEKPSASSTSTEDVATDTKEGTNNITHIDSDKMESSVDSTKHIKGIINMQIREGRKHNGSNSTSENSDATTDAGGSDGDARGDLTDYIVVDVDDVHHTTVEMYSAGLYHQRRVRAGAAPGWAACEGLLLLLRDTIAVLPDHALAQATCGAVQPSALVVLANHRQASVRAALVRAVAALTRRAPPDLARKLRAQHYYLHLANQISLYEGSWELAAACAALLTKCDVPLEDQLDDDIWVDITEESVHRCPPLLALLPSCLADVPLAHNITLILRRVIDKASLKVLSEVSLVEVAVRAVRAVGLMPDAHFEGRDLLLDDLHELLNRVAIKALASQHTMQTVCEIHHLLSYVEAEGEAEGEVEGEGGSLLSSTARGAQLALYHAQLDYLEERLHASYAPPTRSANYFANVVSGAESGAGGAARLLSAASRAVAFLLSASPAAPLHQHAQLALRLLSMLLLAVSGPSSSRPKWWAGGGGDWSAPLCELFWWVASPAPGTRRLQPALLRALYSAPPPALLLLAPDPPAQRKLAVYLLTILKHIHAEAETGPPSVELAITDWARGWAVATQAGLPDRLDSDTLALEADSLLRADLQRWAKAAARMRPAIAKAVFSKEGVAGKVSETAMAMTRQVVEAQNGERKRFMEQLRRAHARAAARASAWRHLVDTLTHQHAVWHDPTSYPTSWQLDPTEGPGRVRVRLRRAHLNIHPRFLKPQFRHKLDAVKATPPLRSVLESAGSGSSARLQPDEPVSYMARVTRVAVAADTRGDLLLTDRCLHFVPDDAPDEDGDAAPAESWPLDALLQVVTRRWCLQELAVELFLSSGHAHMLAFADEHERAAFLKALNASHLPARIEADTLTEAMSQWRNGTITNWEYLMRLNGLAGRSYNDLMQYPVLPFVIADYTSKILDLNDPASFRDLSKPMAVQNKNREQHYINVYNDLKAARREGCSPLLSRQPHHYASLYSNSGGVLHYLVRVPPFTKLFLNYQDNNFDMPDRTFHSLATTWRLITNDSPTDVKELIPELFYLPELFHNNEGLNLGVRQCGAGVDSVEVPAWAADARVFTLLHRQALESPLVTEHLPHWIDLVFGYKQTGQPALDAINVFPACTYYGFDPSALEDEVERTAAAAMVRTYGQAPRQLLRTPHPRRHTDLLRAHQGANGESGEEPEVWAGVRGARWGRYCGSPALPPPALAAKRSAAAGVTLQPLPMPRAAALVPRASALLHLHGDPGAANSRGTLALVTWGHSDGIVRLKRRRDVPPDMLLQVPSLDQVTTVSSWCASATCPYPLLMGHASGRVVCVRVESVGAAGGGAAGGALRVRTRTLHAHAAAVADMFVCARSRLLATASVDGTIILWDLNDLTYIRTLPNRDMLPVTHVTISETLCDVASVHELAPRAPSENNNVGDAQPRDSHADTLADTHAHTDDYEKDTTYKHKSLIRVHTCNATFVGSVKVSEQVTCVCYSRAPEGVSVNCVAAGLASGGVRLYSSWDLRPLTYLPPVHARAPTLTLSYSSDSMVVFASYGDGTAAAWESGTARAPVRLVPALALL